MCDITEFKPNNQWRIIEDRVTREGKMLWVSFTEIKDVGPNRRGLVGLIGIDLEDKSLRTFWNTSFPPLNTYLTGPLKVTKSVVSPEATYLGIWGLGIVKFPGTARQGIETFESLEIISEKDGLPSNYISDIARIDNILYIS